MRARRQLRRIAAGSAAVLAGTAGVAFAAGLEVRSERLGAVTVTGTITPRTCTLPPVADAYVDSGAPLVNYGADSLLRVRSDAPVRRSFVRFDIASCVPPGARVRSASLRLRIVETPAASRNYGARRVTGSWTETAVTWGAQPSVASQPTSTTTTGTSAGVTLTWAVTADVQDIAATGTADNGWRLADLEEGSLSLGTGTRFASREHATESQRPTLTISFDP